MFGFNHLVVTVDKSQQSESNSSSSTTHLSQEPCLMALNIDKRPGAKPVWAQMALFITKLGLSVARGAYTSYAT